MQATDLASFLVVVASGGLSVVISKLFEQWLWFNALSSNGKTMAVIGASAGLAMLAVLVQGMVAQRPFINDLVDPYIKVLLPFFNLLVTQITHGSERAITQARALAMQNRSGQ